MAPDERVDSVDDIHGKQPDNHGQGGNVSSAPVPWRRDENEESGENGGGGEFAMHPALLR